MTRKMKKKITRLFFPSYSPWEKLLVTQYGLRYRLILVRRNEDSGLYQFKSVFISEIDENPTVEEIYTLIK